MTYLTWFRLLGLSSASLLLILAPSAPSAPTVQAQPPAQGKSANQPKHQGKKYTVEQTLDLRYFADHERQVLDVFSPQGLANAPVLLFVHGGTWMAGDKDFFGLYRRLGHYLAANGIVAVLINYRLSPLVQHPEHVKDVARAYAWTTRNIQRYRGDNTRIFLCGHSAGGHLVSLLATNERLLADGDLKLTPAERAALRGVIAVSGVYRIPAQDEFRNMFDESLDIVLGAKGNLPEPMRQLRAGLFQMRELINPFAIVFGRAPEVQFEASPLYHVRRGQPPFLLLYAESEVAGLRMMARDFAASLQMVSVPVELRCIEGCTHHNILFRVEEADSTVGPELVGFVRRLAK